MKRRLLSFCTLLGLLISVTTAEAHDWCNIELTIEKFMGQIAGCLVSASIEEVAHVGNLSGDHEIYAELVPSVHLSDFRVIASLDICPGDETSSKNDYMFFLREEAGSYNVISYSSFSQPE